LATKICQRSAERVRIVFRVPLPSSVATMSPSAWNAELYSRPGVVTCPVVDLSPAELAVAWRADNDRPDRTAAAPRPPRHGNGF
jgi:hypothetical protein